MSRTVVKWSRKVPAAFVRRAIGVFVKGVAGQQSDRMRRCSDVQGAAWCRPPYVDTIWPLADSAGVRVADSGWFLVGNRVNGRLYGKDNGGGAPIRRSIHEVRGKVTNRVRIRPGVVR
ncbi:hypothetical protein GCM10009754_03160 [Amycolatopsis minnesotensis]|uniref:Uncharacterized protein n=1 Tax=Amycolatopsis minnesotensis TaxID=337894 RepID=A0ABP5BE38_9PSEU